MTQGELSYLLLQWMVDRGYNVKVWYVDPDERWECSWEFDGCPAEGYAPTMSGAITAALQDVCQLENAIKDCERNLTRHR